MAKINIEVELEKGMLFKNEKQIYLLAQTSKEDYSLIGFDDGNRWIDYAPIERIADELISENFKCIGNISNYKINLEEKDNNILNQNLTNDKNESKEKMSDEEFEANPFKKGLDTIFDLLEKASKYTNADEKQHRIYECMLEYCKIFKIPENELMEDIAHGKEPK